MARSLLLLVVAVLLSCGPSPRAKIPKQPGRVDAPYELASDDDLDAVRELYDALPLDDAQRTGKRNELAAEYRRRITVSLRRSDRSLAFDQFKQLLRLWRPEELATAHEQPTFAGIAPAAQALRTTFARSGGDIEAASALFSLALMQPEQAAQHYTDIEEIFRYGDELAMLEHGPGAERSRPIQILETTATFLPSAQVVDRLIALYIERQVAIKSSFRRKGADIQLLRVHGPGVLTSTHNIVRVLAESRRIDEAMANIADLSGIGDDAKLRKRVGDALASTDPTAWLLLATSFRETEGEEMAALQICREAIARYPQESMSYACAGDAAVSWGNAPLAIRYFEASLALDPSQREASESLAALYEQRVSALAYSDRPNAALAQLATFETFHQRTSKRFDTPIEPDLASAYGAMARGLVSLGELEEAQRYLARSLKLRPSVSAYEYLGTIALRQDQFAEAQREFAKAIALPGDDFYDIFQRARLRRLAAEATAGLSGAKAAQALREQAFGDWLELLNKYELSPEGEAEARIEIGKLIFHMGKDEEAMSEFLTALDTEASTSDHADIVAFLLQNKKYSLAKDIYLDALGRHGLGQYYKIYMSLWILAEAKHLGLEPDYHATNYLRGLEGQLWSVRLAKYALGESDGTDLQAQATTRGRRAEFLYYRAVLGPESGNPEIVKQLLEEVVRGSMVLFFEYDMAKRRLREML